MEAKPYYKLIYDSLLKDISSGKLKAGNRVPSEKELCEKFKVSRITSKKALELLAEQGWIVRFTGKGSFVTGTSKEPSHKGLSNTLAFLIPDYSDAFGTYLLNGILDASAALGYHLILKRTHDKIQEEEKAIRALVSEGAAGFLILPAHGEFYNPEILKLNLDKKPLVFVDRKMHGLKIPSVSTGHLEAASLGVEYLFRLGHRHIGFYSGSLKDTSSLEERRDGFIRTFLDFGIDCASSNFCHTLKNTYMSPAAKEVEDYNVGQVKEHLMLHRDLTAAFVTEHSMAFFVKQAAVSLGLEIPRDLSILTFDSPPYMMGSPAFTYLLQDEYAIGNQAVGLLHSLITGTAPDEPQDITVSARLVLGSSTAAISN